MVTRQRIGRRWAVYLLASTILAACDPSAGGATTTASPESVSPPEDVATAVIDALAKGDAATPADRTVAEQMPWLAMAEGASLSQASDLVDTGSRQVAINFWQGFSEGGGLPELEVGQVEEFEVGSHRFASVVVGFGRRLRLVLRLEDQWRVDIVASFGSSLASRLRDALDVVAANSGPEADRLTEVITRQRDSVTVASDGVGLNDSALRGLDGLVEAIDLLGT